MAFPYSYTLQRKNSYVNFKEFFIATRFWLTVFFIGNCLDGSHRLDKYEVQYWLENHGKYITLRQAQKIIDQMDFNADGYVEYSDFLATILGTWLGTFSSLRTSNVTKVRFYPEGNLRSNQHKHAF